METQKENLSDHDLLIELRTEMRAVREDIKRMTDNTDKTISDHENRIRNLEDRVQSVPLITKLVYGEVTLILIAVLSAIIYQVIPK